MTDTLREVLAHFETNRQIRAAKERYLRSLPWWAWFRRWRVKRRPIF